LSANDVSKGTMILSSLHVPFAELKLFGFGRILHLTYFYVNHVKTKRRKKIFSPDIFSSWCIVLYFSKWFQLKNCTFVLYKSNKLSLGYNKSIFVPGIAGKSYHRNSVILR
jgi:hypothetical protein